MSMSKAIASGKEHRKEYTGAKQLPGHRNHGNCRWCFGNRIYSTKKQDERCRQELKEWNLNN